MRLAAIVLVLALAACSTTTKREAPSSPSAGAPSPPSFPPLSGKYYKDDGPGEHPPDNLDSIPEAVPKLEPLARYSNRPYTVFGVEYVPATSLRPYKERGIASWYGRKFHNQKTSNGEVYDMYAMTAAHPTLPLPSYAKVTNVATGKAVVVRVNDRGPFHPGRVIDLSYAAAYRIGIAQKGSGMVEVESIIPNETPLQALTPPLPPVAVAEAAVAPSAEAEMPLAQEPGGYVVQLGAFSNYANAQTFVAHLSNQLAPLSVEARVHQEGAGGLFRVSVGPYPSRDEAKRMGERLRGELGLDSTVRQR
jgi:rare lipoprotein A